jgi:AcrR family transcriptional regulator
MPKGFSDNQKEKINKALLEMGKVLFSQYGIKKTSIADLTKAVGISQGAFYQFFPSKEMLFYSVLKEEELKIKAQLLEEVDFASDDIKGNLKKIMYWTLDLAENNPFIKQMMAMNELEIVMDGVSKDATEGHMKEDEDFFMEIISKWQQDERLIKIKTEVLVGVFGVIFTLPRNKKVIGEANYNQTIDLIIDSLAEGLLRRA